MSDGKIEFSTDSARRLGENVLDVIAVTAGLIWIDIALDFNVIPQFAKTLVAWPTLVGSGWLLWKFVRGHQWFK